MAAAAASDRVITREELAKHNKKDDLWLLICGRVYDVTEYQDNHPGGVERLMAVAPPQDATQEWRRAEGGGHSRNARQRMQKLMVGRIEGGASDPEHEKWLDPMHQFDRDTLNKQEATGFAFAPMLAAIIVAIAVGVGVFLPDVRELLGL
eukprot:TRINITY_DN2188_c0_g1_i1.p1 TRINITY_DN2188_c0_g1~~TRINITY_DN2188_c0_g1_i1.p1  ORF type:complete len:170 (+),score=74.83 TRINITY_DN2188_c0_g1_i1:63-512(+)